MQAEQLDLGAAIGEAQNKVTGWLEALVAALPNFLAALIVLLLFWVAARLLRSAAARTMRRVADHQAIIDLVANVVSIVVLGTGLFLALGVLQLDRTVTSLLAGAGIVGLAIGFAFQSIAENFLAGIIMAIRRPFRIGDVLETNDFMGTVERLEMRSTILRTFQGQEVRVPNGQVFKNPVVNFTDRFQRRIDLEVGVTYGEDLEQVRSVTKQAVEGVPGRLDDRDVEVYFTGFGDSSIDLVARFWIPFQRQSEFFAARSEAVMRIKQAYDDAGITIPFPIRTLDFGPVGGVTLDEAWKEQQRDDTQGSGSRR